jgi:hypothetical protein
MDRRTVAAALRRGQPASLEIADPDDFSAGEVLADGFRTWLSQLPAFAAVALLLHAPLLFFAFLPPLPRPLLVTCFVVAEFAVALLVQAALVKAVIDGQRQLLTEFAEHLQALRCAPAVLALGARIAARAAMGLLLVVPGLAYVCATFAAVPAVIVEGGSGEQALRRSQQLTRGVRVDIFGVCLVIWSLAAVLTLASGMLGAASLSTTWLVVYLCTRALDSSLAAVLSAIAYHHLCERPEP